MFAITSMPVGGAETLLANLVRRMDRAQFAPQLCCLKEVGVLGEELVREMPVHCRMLRNKFDVRVLPRLVRLMRRERIDAVVTVGAGDKMFWGRLAAWLAGVPVIASALHSTGWPDGVGRLNRLLTPITDAFIAVAAQHGQFLVQHERFPPDKVRVIPNGVDTDRFQRCESTRRQLREALSLPTEAPVCGIVAALRPEKNHSLFLKAAAIVHQQLPQAHFLIVGDGPERNRLQSESEQHGLARRVHFLGTRNDIPELLSTLDLFALTSDNEANPVSILEAMSVQLPVVATDVGSVSETVKHGITGFLTEPGDEVAVAGRWQELLSDVPRAGQLGQAGRDSVVDSWSVQSMVSGYERLIAQTYDSKLKAREPRRAFAQTRSVESGLRS